MIGIAGGTVTTFLPLIVYLIMTLVMCPNILRGANFKDENDVYSERIQQMFHIDDEKSIVPEKKGIRKSNNEDDDNDNGGNGGDDILDQMSHNSVKSFRSYTSTREFKDLENDDE